ncbi:hypothetical protein JD844_006107 [Phrynosoma platyrhinos]|uniref:E3 ubiquitin-protein ligase CBL n=1 Tax=Phrynosoma platyrhinos TaxID=52577 RepID=A0ABQ7TQD5_PHRPL|nr:hypothetical protein JD844_006107 [Phrynosoma platyrhinos]
MATRPGNVRTPRWVSAPRSMEKALQGLAKLQQLVSQPRLGLRNSPPHLPYLVPQTYQHLRLIQERHGAGLAQIGEGGYLPVFLANLQEKIKKTTRLFRREKEEIFKEGSTARRNLTKLSLIFSHMVAELQALFPEGQDQGSTYQLNKPEAQSFWRETWGTRSLVSWAEFREGLQRVHPVEPGAMAVALRSTIDLTCSGHISVFEFDVFTRLFQNWTYLAVTHPGYMAFLTYDEVKARLQAYTNKPGSYLYPDGKNANPDLTDLTEAVSRNRIRVSQYSEAHTCPFCRHEIWGHKDIVIETFSYKEEPPGPEEGGDEGDLEDVESVLQELAPSGNAVSSPCPDPEFEIPPLPPRTNLPRQKKVPNPDYQASENFCVWQKVGQPPDAMGLQPPACLTRQYCEMCNTPLLTRIVSGSIRGGLNCKMVYLC